MVNIHVLVDTNVLIRASLQETERIELLKMLEFAKKRLIKFTMFEIVLDEFEKHNNKLEETLNKEIAKVSKGIREAISNCKLWNELNDLSNYVINALYNYKGEKYNLPDYVDKNTGFISYKSKDGRELKALELPGLWNGAMSDWNTVFVEVPIETFNPVKTVNDLLRSEHQ